MQLPRAPRSHVPVMISTEPILTADPLCVLRAFHSRHELPTTHRTPRQNDNHLQQDRSAERHLRVRSRLASMLGVGRLGPRREPAFRGRQFQSGDHVVEGLHDSLVEGCKDLLQMTTRHDQLAECGIVCFAR